MHVGNATMKYPFDCLTDLVFVPEEKIVQADIILVPGGSHVQPMKIASLINLKKVLVLEQVLTKVGFTILDILIIQMA